MPRPIVLVTGVFDLLHAGHIQLLQWAAQFGDVAVGIDHEDTIPQLDKGPGRPIFGNEERVAVLQALECVGFVHVFRGPGATEAIKAVRPALWVKGGDYGAGQLMAEELDAATEVGAGTCFAPRFESISTSEIVARIRGDADG